MFLKHRNETLIAFRKFSRDVKFDGIARNVCSDESKEFMDKFEDLCLEREIKYELIAPGTPQQNGAAESALIITNMTQRTVGG